MYNKRILISFFLAGDKSLPRFNGIYLYGSIIFLFPLWVLIFQLQLRIITQLTHIIIQISLELLFQLHILFSQEYWWLVFLYIEFSTAARRLDILKFLQSHYVIFMVNFRHFVIWWTLIPRRQRWRRRCRPQRCCLMLWCFIQLCSRGLCQA